jgi:hypothetical protein
VPGVEALRAAEVGVKALLERRQALDALGAVEELWGAGDDDVEAGVDAGVEVVDELAEGVEALFAAVARTRWIVSTSSRTRRRPLRPVWCRTASRPRKKPEAPRWSRSPLISAARLMPAPTLG